MPGDQATQKEPPERVNQVKGYINSLVSIKTEQVCSRDNLGQYNFSAFAATLGSVRVLAAYGQHFDFESLPVPLTDLVKSLQTLHNMIRAMGEFSVVDEPSTAKRRHEELLSTLKTNLKREADQFALFVLSCHVLAADEAEGIQKAEALDRELQEARRINREIQSVLGAARQAGEQVGVERHTEIFATAAQRHERTAKWWVFIACVLAAGAIALSLPLIANSIWPAPAQATASMHSVTAVQWIASRVVVMAILYLAAFWAIRNHRAHRHLAVVNRHRQNALATFETFVKGARDEETKNAVLLEATRCIFSPSVTGYLGAQEETPDSPLVEVIRTIRKTSSPS